MKLIRTEDAVGQVLCHDLTRIVRGEMKSVQFKKGHIVKAEDIPMLLSMGKENLYIYEMDENTLHEDDAAERLYTLCAGGGENMGRKGPSEGKIELYAKTDGLFLTDADRMEKINSIGEIMIATRHGGTVVKAGDKLLGTRVIPLVIEKAKLTEAERIAGSEPLVSLRPYKPMKAGVITTGTEVFSGRIKDTFTPVVVDKLQAYGITAAAHTVTDDKAENILSAIRAMREQNLDLILCTGGMSVDPDDRTPAAIMKSGADIVTYGAPVLPGAMLLIGYYDDGVPVMGLPGCVMYARATIFDMLLPYIASNTRIERRTVARLGDGGLCLGCDECTYPHCGFGKC